MRLTLRQAVRYEAQPIKGSRFIADLAPATTEVQAQALLTRVRTEFPDASHHCSAWRIASPAVERANDDGEPGGSAGRPILAQIIGRDLIDIAIVVTRWFGGTKLGVGGLVRAYGGTAGEALNAAELHRWVVMGTITLTYDYTYTDAIDRLVGDLEGAFVSRSFEAQVHSIVELGSDDIDAFTHQVADVTNGTALIGH